VPRKSAGAEIFCSLIEVVVFKVDFTTRELNLTIRYSAGVPVTASFLQMAHSIQLAECTESGLEPAVFRRLMRSILRNISRHSNEVRRSVLALPATAKRQCPRLRSTAAISLSPRHLARHRDHPTMMNFHFDISSSSVDAIHIKRGLFRVLGDENETEMI